MGSASLDDVAEELKIKLPVDEYETFGGYISVNSVRFRMTAAS